MRRATGPTLIIAAFAIGVLAASVVPAAARRAHCRHCAVPFQTLVPVPEIEGPPPIYPYGQIPDPGVPYNDIPFGWDDRGSGGPPASQNFPYSQGFVLTYTVRHTDEARPGGALSRYAEVGKALAGCWSSSDATRKDWHEMTLRVSFKRDGSINGIPRIQHLDAPGDAGEHSKLQSDFIATLDQCAPLRFTPALGAAIAGQIFAIRFIQAKDT